MVRNLLTSLTLLAASALSACTPGARRPCARPCRWPTPGRSRLPTRAQRPPPPMLGWRDVFVEPRLQGVIDLSLANNRDLRVAAAQHRAVPRPVPHPAGGALLPTVAASATGTKRAKARRPRSSPAAIARSRSTRPTWASRPRRSTCSAGSAASAPRPSRTTWPPAEIGRSVRISLIAQTASAWPDLAADQDLLALAEETLRTRQETMGLIQRRFEAGAISQLKVSQAQTLIEGARSDVAAAQALLEQDKNALRLAVGADVPADLLPAGGLVTAQHPARPAGRPAVRRSDLPSRRARRRTPAGRGQRQYRRVPGGLLPQHQPDRLDRGGQQQPGQPVRQRQRGLDTVVFVIPEV